MDYLKIDKGFVHAIQPDGEEAPVLDVIIMLAHRLGLSVVAEGVEQRFQFDYLTERGVGLHPQRQAQRRETGDGFHESHTACFWG